MPRTSHMTCNLHALLASVHLCHPIHFPEIHGRIWGIDAVVPLVFLFCSTDILGLLSYFSLLPNNDYTLCITSCRSSGRPGYGETRACRSTVASSIFIRRSLPLMGADSANILRFSYVVLRKESRGLRTTDYVLPSTSNTLSLSRT